MDGGYAKTKQKYHFVVLHIRKMCTEIDGYISIFKARRHFFESFFYPSSCLKQGPVLNSEHNSETLYTIRKYWQNIKVIFVDASLAKYYNIAFLAISFKRTINHRQGILSKYYFVSNILTEIFFVFVQLCIICPLI